jgi:hypothetical protein
MSWDFTYTPEQCRVTGSDRRGENRWTAASARSCAGRDLAPMTMIGVTQAQSRFRLRPRCCERREAAVVLAVPRWRRWSSQG